MKINEVFFYQGSHNTGHDFLFNGHELVIVKTSYVNFDNDEEGLHLKKLDAPEVYKAIEMTTKEFLENPFEKLNQLLQWSDEQYNSIFKF